LSKKVVTLDQGCNFQAFIGVKGYRNSTTQHWILPSENYIVIMAKDSKNNIAAVINVRYNIIIAKHGEILF